MLGVNYLSVKQKKKNLKAEDNIMAIDFIFLFVFTKDYFIFFPTVKPMVS